MNALFVSEAHIRTVVYRTDAIYRTTFKVAVSTFFLLALAVGTYVYLQLVEQTIIKANVAIQAETAIIAKDEEKVAPLLKRISDVSHWKPVIEQRLRVTDVLSKIEASTTLNVCIKSIELQNQLTGARSLDSQTVTIDGWTRASALSPFIQNLGNALPGYLVKMDAANEADATAETKPFRLILTNSHL